MSRCWVLALPIIAGISFFKWLIIYAWILAALARLTNSLICRDVNRWRVNAIEGPKQDFTTEFTRRSQAFLGISFRSEIRSSCSLSKSSFPIGPMAASFTGLSLKELLHSVYKTKATRWTDLLMIWAALSKATVSCRQQINQLILMCQYQKFKQINSFKQILVLERGRISFFTAISSNAYPI